MVSLPQSGPRLLIASTSGSFNDLAVHAPMPGGGFAVVSMQETGPDFARFGLQIRDGFGQPLAVVDLGGLAPAGFSGLPRLIACEDGKLVLAWTSAFDPAVGRSVWVRTFGADGQALSEAEQISPAGTPAELTDLVSLPSGGFAASWAAFNQGPNPTPNKWNVHVGLFDTGPLSGEVLRLNGLGGLAESSACLAVQEDGSFTALWFASDGASSDLMLRRFAADGTPLAIEQVVASSLTSPADLAVLALADGSVLLSYAETVHATDPAQSDLKQAHFTLIGPSAAPVVFDYVPQTTGGQIWDAKALQLRDGRLLLSWAEPAGNTLDGTFIRKAVFVGPDLAVSDPVTLIGAEFTITPGFGLMELADGRIAVSWTVPDLFGATDTALQIFDPRLTGVTLTADDGAQSWLGSRFADNMTGGAGHDTILGAGHADRLQGGGGNDLLRGGRGADTLSGGSGDDQLRGGAGKDLLIGGQGNDSLTGGDNADVFVLAPAVGAEMDVITDFQVGQDRLDLTGFGFATPDLALGHFSQSAGGVVFAQGDGQVLLSGLTLSSLRTDDLLV